MKVYTVFERTVLKKGKYYLHFNVAESPSMTSILSPIEFLMRPQISTWTRNDMMSIAA